MLKEGKTKKDMLLEFGQITEVNINNGKFFILTKQQRLRPRDSMKNSVSTSTDHST